MTSWMTGKYMFCLCYVVFTSCSILDEPDLSRSASPYCPPSRLSRFTSPQMAKRAYKRKRASKEDETDAALLHMLSALAARPNKEEVDPYSLFLGTCFPPEEVATQAKSFSET